MMIREVIRANTLGKKAEIAYVLISACPFPSFRLVRNLPLSGCFLMILPILRHKDRFRTSRNDKNEGGIDIFRRSFVVCHSRESGNPEEDVSNAIALGRL
ncbi:hypothetical protein [Candidatus Magnetominusculus dajiuhuensis]|uniref:hypothetical protein n=1 Tax=Candidatus Magnetominusculus dajiuhuensis TaxID=3137712 RepID=UPI0019D95E99|nr:hypothetical protein [Nitrospirota bacterium]